MSLGEPEDTLDAQLLERISEIDPSLWTGESASADRISELIDSKEDSSLTSTIFTEIAIESEKVKS